MRTGVLRDATNAGGGGATSKGDARDFPGSAIWTRFARAVVARRNGTGEPFSCKFGFDPYESCPRSSLRTINGRPAGFPGLRIGYVDIGVPVPFSTLTHLSGFATATAAGDGDADPSGSEPRAPEYVSGDLVSQSESFRDNVQYLANRATQHELGLLVDVEPVLRRVHLSGAAGDLGEPGDHRGGVLGTMVLVLPTEDRSYGGELVVKHAGWKRKMRTGVWPREHFDGTDACCCAFLAGCTHHLEAVETDQRVLLVYDLVDATPREDAAVDAEASACAGDATSAPETPGTWGGVLRDITRVWSDVALRADPPADVPQRLVVPLEHAYCSKTPPVGADALRGKDAVVARMLMGVEGLEVAVGRATTTLGFRIDREGESCWECAELGFGTWNCMCGGQEDLLSKYEDEDLYGEEVLEEHYGHYVRESEREIVGENELYGMDLSDRELIVEREESWSSLRDGRPRGGGRSSSNVVPAREVLPPTGGRIGTLNWREQRAENLNDDDADEIVYIEHTYTRWLLQLRPRMCSVDQARRLALADALADVRAQVDGDVATLAPERYSQACAMLRVLVERATRDRKYMDDALQCACLAGDAEATVRVLAAIDWAQSGQARDLVDPASVADAVERFGWDALEGALRGLIARSCAEKSRHPLCWGHAQRDCERGALNCLALASALLDRRVPQASRACATVIELQTRDPTPAVICGITTAAARLERFGTVQAVAAWLQRCLDLDNPAVSAAPRPWVAYISKHESDAAAFEALARLARFAYCLEDLAKAALLRRLDLSAVTAILGTLQPDDASVEVWRVQLVAALETELAAARIPREKNRPSPSFHRARSFPSASRAQADPVRRSLDAIALLARHDAPSLLERISRALTDPSHVHLLRRLAHGDSPLANATPGAAAALRRCAAETLARLLRRMQGRACDPATRPDGWGVRGATSADGDIPQNFLEADSEDCVILRGKLDPPSLITARRRAGSLMARCPLLWAEGVGRGRDAGVLVRKTPRWVQTEGNRSRLREIEELEEGFGIAPAPPPPVSKPTPQPPPVPVRAPLPAPPPLQSPPPPATRPAKRPDAAERATPLSRPVGGGKAGTPGTVAVEAAAPEAADVRRSKRRRRAPVMDSFVVS